jgi:hypothetical protein
MTLSTDEPAGRTSVPSHLFALQPQMPCTLKRLLHVTTRLEPSIFRDRADANQIDLSISLIF